MDLQELREKAKELGIKSAHLMKEDTLVEKIKELSGEDVVPTFEGNKFMKDVEAAKEEKNKDTDGNFQYVVRGGKVFVGERIYVKGDKFKSPKGNLDKKFEVEKV